MQRHILTLALAAGLAFAAFPTAAAQPSVMNASCQAKDWHGEENEFGRICMKFQESMMGKPMKLDARIVLHHIYDERQSAYFLFMVAGAGTPFKVTDVKIATADGKELPIFKKEGGDGSNEAKLFIDVADMPPAETELVLSATVNSCDRGMYQIGALVQPFNYRWQKIVMNNGEPADIYSFTQVGVNEASCKGGIPGLPKVDAPAGGLVASVAALGLVGLVLRRRR